MKFPTYQNNKYTTGERKIFPFIKCIIYLSNYHNCEYMCLNAPHRLETPCLSLRKAHVAMLILRVGGPEFIHLSLSSTDSWDVTIHHRSLYGVSAGVESVQAAPTCGGRLMQGVDGR